MTLIKTMPFDDCPGIMADSLVPKYHLLYHYLKGDVAIFAARRILEASEPSDQRRKQHYVCATSYRKFVSPIKAGIEATNIPGVQILSVGEIDIQSLLDSMSARIVLPQFIGSPQCMGAAIAYASNHSLTDYLSAIQILLRENLLSSSQALDFLRMPAHLIWGFCAGTSRLDHFIDVATKLELSVMALLKSGYISEYGWTDNYQERWMAFFMERYASYLYLECLAKEGLFSWRDNGSFVIHKTISQGYNCNINLPHQPADILERGTDLGIW